ncbi:MAG: hypothetical protein WBB69_09605 [Anaerolineales bacterium]
MDWTKTATAIVAIYGAIISTYTLYRQYKARHAQIEVELNYYLPSNRPVNAWSINLRAKNKSQFKVILNSIGFILPERKVHLPTGWKDGKFLETFHHSRQQELPIELEPHSSYETKVPAWDFAQSISRKGFKESIKVCAFFVDGLGNKHKSKHKRFNIEEVINS